jgi:DNA-binding helix-hairpin-helix protein with protein kinase domain
MKSVAYDHNGNVVQLVDTGKCGGEGDIYIDKKRPDVCAKIYREENITEELHRKILAMVKNPPEDPTRSTGRHVSIAWPQAALYDDANRNHFIGYTMPFIDTNIFRESHKYYDVDDRLKEIGEIFTWEHLLRSSLNFTSTVLSIHNQGHCIGDLKETNILVARNATVALIDCDSFQIVDKFYTRVGSGEYSPPELMDANFRDNNYDRHFSDLFALGIIIFKFLMNGVHPYQAKGSAVSDAPTTYEKIIKGYFAYEGRFPGAEPPDYAPPYDIIPPSIKELFRRCFVDGHGDKTKRPTTQEWFNVLDNEMKKLKKCNINDKHRYSDHLSYCPWCKIASDTGKDIFPNHDIPIIALKSIEHSVPRYVDYMTAKIDDNVKADNVNHSSNSSRHVYPKIPVKNKIVTYHSSIGSRSVGVYPKISTQHKIAGYTLNDNHQVTQEFTSFPPKDIRQIIGTLVIVFGLILMMTGGSGCLVGLIFVLCGYLANKEKIDDMINQIVRKMSKI